ncbi:lysophospholipid acyltransferase family protein [Vulgatibacter sp.]|uniref:lysophospholipid acyltransferase family protein n=1 Tax=Vulgatibacter sp. TaxID=1971226 RepID=UPI00356B3533
MASWIVVGALFAVVLFVLGVVASQGRLLGWLVARLPHPLLLALGKALGALLAAVGVRRRIALANLAQAFPERDAGWRARTLRIFYDHLGLLVAEFLRAPYLRPERLDELVEVEGFERFAPEFAKGQGAIVATAHFGNFELLGSFFATRGMPVTAITKRLSRNFANAFWLDQRRRAGLREVADSGSIRDILKVLRAGEILAVMIDQNMIPRRAIFAPFFGKLAATTPAPAIFAHRTGAPVFLALMHRLPGGRHRVTVEGPIPFEHTGDRDADVAAFTAKLNRELERHVRAEPASWYWVHRRWKTRPPEETAAPGPVAALE